MDNVETHLRGECQCILQSNIVEVVSTMVLDTGHNYGKQNQYLYTIYIY